jgi:hypothetical protein
MSRKTKRVHKRHKSHHNKRTKRNLYRKKREIVTVPGSHGLPLFSAPVTKKSSKILVNSKRELGGNIIPGLRNM